MVKDIGDIGTKLVAELNSSIIDQASGTLKGLNANEFSIGGLGNFVSNGSILIELSRGLFLLSVL